MHRRSQRKIAFASVSHCLHDVFHGFAKEVDKEQVQQEHRGDHGATQHKVVLAMKSTDELAMRTLEHERFDETGVWAICNWNCFQELTI